MKKYNIALFHIGISNLSGGGGAQRFFIDFFYRYYNGSPKHNLFFFTDKNSYNDITLKSDYQKIRKRILKLLNINNRFKKILENIHLLYIIIVYRLDLIHICQYYHETFYDKLIFIQKLPKNIRPKIVINFIHCTFPYEYNNTGSKAFKIFHQKFDPLFQNIKIDGIYSWYDLFKEYVEKNKIIRSNPFIYPVKYCFCNSENFFPANEKKNIIVFAAWLTAQKNPLMFIEAINLLDKSFLEGWKVLICGQGEQEEIVKQKIKDYHLADWAELRNNVTDMAAIFNESKCFVSTQEYENFTSLSMNEAMASGNAIIARNVGQTYYYVKENSNGFLAKEDSAKGIADCLINYLKHPTLHERMQKESVRICYEVHTANNFIKEIDDFWEKIFKN